MPTALVGPALLPGRALLPASFLLHFEPWRSVTGPAPQAHWDPLVWDGIAQFYPWRHFAAGSLRASVIPLWNPYQFCGTPFLANGQSAVLYPLNIIFWLLPTARAFAWSSWLHLCLTGWFAYLLLRRMGAGRAGAAAGAVAWQGNGFFIAWMHLPTALATAAWLPLILLLFEGAIARGGFRRVAPAGLALGAALLGGHPQMFLIVALLAGPYLLARGLSRAGGDRAGACLARLVSVGAMTALVGVGIAAAQLLPTLELARIAHRAFTPGAESYAAYLSHAMPPLQLIGLAVPHAFGHPSEGTYIGRDNYAELVCYVGIIALPLALWAAVAVRTWHARFFAAAALLSLAVALGTVANLPLYRWVPGIARTGGPGRFLLLTAFSLSALAGLGVDRLAAAKQHRAVPAALIALAGAVALAHAVILAPTLETIEAGLQALGAAEARRGVGLVALALIALAAFRGSRARIAPAALALIFGADLLMAAQGHLHITPAAWAYPPIPITVSDRGRVLGNAADWPIDRFPVAALPPNSATVYRMRDAFGYDSLYLARYRDFAAALQHGDPSPPLNGNLLLARLGPVYGLDMMSLAGVETVVSPGPVRGLEAEREEPGYLLLRNPYARPRAWVAGSAIVASSHIDAVVTLTRLGPMPDCIILTGPEDLPAVPAPAARPEVTLRDVSPNRVDAQIEGRGGGYLFIADAFAPGWKAYADGAELPIAPANVAFRAVALPPDAAIVTFGYEPAAFHIGLFAALVTLAAVAAAGSVHLMGRR